jgi:hypothetical protein
MWFSPRASASVRLGWRQCAASLGPHVGGRAQDSCKSSSAARSCLLGAFILAISILPLPSHAAEVEPAVYLFWSASSPYSIRARGFLQRLKADEPGLRVREFEVDESLSNAVLLGQIYENIGLPGVAAVPLVVIGHHLIIGYIDDEHTGQEIVETIAECRKAACRDPIRGLIDGMGVFDGVSLHPLP